jgi:hypothetical protein
LFGHRALIDCSSFGNPACGKPNNFVIPRHAACRGISLFLGFNEGEIPRFARNDKIKYSFRTLYQVGLLLRSRNDAGQIDRVELVAARSPLDFEQDVLPLFQA